jgi:small subunit ribosomal protein S16
MLMIRLARRGKKNKPFYRVVVSEKARDLYGKALDIVGHYDPTSPKKDCVLDGERIRYWISKGAKASPTMYNLLVEQKIIEGKKIQGTTKKKEEKK